MNIQFTCRFCKRNLIYEYMMDSPVDYISRYKCNPCDSIQFFADDGKPLHYWFNVGNYQLYFMPDRPCFEIAEINKYKTPIKIIFELKWLPHNLTPQTTTVERIKTFITFS